MALGVPTCDGAVRTPIDHVRHQDSGTEEFIQAGCDAVFVHPQGNRQNLRGTVNVPGIVGVGHESDEKSERKVAELLVPGKGEEFRSHDSLLSLLDGHCFIASEDEVSAWLTYGPSRGRTEEELRRRKPFGCGRGFPSVWLLLKQHLEAGIGLGSPLLVSTSSFSRLPIHAMDISSSKSRVDHPALVLPCREP